MSVESDEINAEWAYEQSLARSADALLANELRLFDGYCRDRDPEEFCAAVKLLMRSDEWDFESLRRAQENPDDDGDWTALLDYVLEKQKGLNSLRFLPPPPATVISPTVKVPRFTKADSRLFGWDGYKVAEVVKAVFPRIIRNGVLSSADVEYLQLWESGTYFQAGFRPMLLPGRGDDSDIVVCGRGNLYFNDVVVFFRDKAFRLLKSFSERSAPILLNWLLDRNVDVGEIMKTAGLPISGLFVECDDVDAPIKMGGNNPLVSSSSVKKPKIKRLLTDKCSEEELMSNLYRLTDGSIAAKDVALLLKKQLKLHKYTCRAFSAGAGLQSRVVGKWLSGQCVIHPDELEKIYKFLKIKTLFSGL